MKGGSWHSGLWAAALDVPGAGETPPTEEPCFRGKAERRHVLTRVTPLLGGRAETRDQRPETRSAGSSRPRPGWRADNLGCYQRAPSAGPPSRRLLEPGKYLTLPGPLFPHLYFGLFHLRRGKSFAGRSHANARSWWDLLAVFL